MIQNPQLNESSTSSMKHFIPQSPATNIKKKEISRWQQRQNKNANQLNLLSNIECYFEQQQPEKPNVSKNSDKCFLRKGGGSITLRNKYEIERQKQAERKRIRELGIIETKPKTQKIILMEQWREKMKKKDKMSRKKKEQIAVSTNIEKHCNKNIDNNQENMNKTMNKSSKQKKIIHDNAVPTNIDKLIDDNDNEQKTPSDELESASKFENLNQFEDGVLIKQHLEHNNNDNNNDQIEEKTEIGIWSKPKLPKKLIIKPQKGYNFARNNVLSNDRIKKTSYPTYSHHHHTSLYGKSVVKKRNNNNNNDHHAPNAKNITTTNRGKYYSETKNLFQKQATINSISKTDRLAAKYMARKANEPQINAEKAYLQKTNELQQIITKYEEKCHDAQIMKQSSLEAFRKYQSLINQSVGNLEEKQKDFEKYKKKQERILCQKTQDLDKRSRALLNIPDRKQRTQIEELKKEINDLKLQFIEKEKRYKSKIERLKKQNKKINGEKIELQNEMKKFEKERLEIWKNKQIENNENNNISKKQNIKRKKKKYSISKINVNTNRPKSHHSMRKERVSYLSTTGPSTMVNRSTNNMYEQFQHQQHENMLNSQSMHNVRLLYDEEYDSTSSESSSCSDESTKNGEDEEKNTVLITNKNISNIKPRKDIKNNINYLADIPDEFDPNKMTEEQMKCESVINVSNPLERMQHPDGKIEHLYSDGSKLILFQNGTEKYIFSNLSNHDQKKYKQIYVKFPNGDIKKILSDGSEVYYYSKNNIIHANKIDGIELFYFTGQHEVHFPDNTKHILFADGTKKYIYPNGEEQCVFPHNNLNQ